MPKTIKKGARGADVERWQTLLASQGFDPNGIDGVFGNGTARATREFQRRHGLTPDGIVGRKTWAAADAATGEPHALKRGSRGESVVKWQRLLDSKGYDPNGIDGVFGAGTEKATKEFQRANGLKADGVVSSATWSKGFGSDVKAAPPKPKPKPKQGSGPLRTRIDVSKIALEPEVNASGSGGVIKAWNRYGGLLTALSDELGIDPDAAAAVLAIESGGTGMTEHGPVIRFENHQFWDHWGKRHPDTFKAHFQYSGSKRWQGHKWRDRGDWATCHKSGQKGEWQVFGYARKLDENAAIQSCSIGLAQIMGFHYRRMGFDSPREMLDAYARSEADQILGFFDFVATSSGDRLLKAIRNKDWYTFAKGYNGGGKYRDYGDKMKAAYNQLRAAK